MIFVEDHHLFNSTGLEETSESIGFRASRLLTSTAVLPAKNLIHHLNGEMPLQIVITKLVTLRLILFS
jgi:hypothetical protein